MNNRDNTLLRLENLKKSYGKFLAINDVNMTLDRGELKALIGPNGAGKTTLIKIISGYFPPDSGDVYFDGNNITGLPPHEICRKGIARSFQVTRVFQRLSLFENVQVALIAHNKKEYKFLPVAKQMYEDEAMGLLKKVDLSAFAEKPAGLLPPGERKRLELAMALANNPILLLLDEPTAGMTPSEKVPITRMLESIVRDLGIAALFTEHDMDFVFSIAQKITVIHQGAIIANGEPDQIRSNSEVQAIYLGKHYVRG